MKKRILTFIIAISMISLLFCGCGKREAEKVSEEIKPESYEEMIRNRKENALQTTVVCWYTDENDKEWLSKTSKDFEKEYGISVDLIKYDGVQLLEDINQADQSGIGPDIYIMGNDQLEFAVLGGVVMENDVFTDGFWKNNYPEISKNALTYKGKQYGFPVYFDTYCMVYDAKLLENAPASIDDILKFLDEYEDTGSTKAIFRWDVADPYINTMFVAAYADLFGENGDDASSFKINGDKEIQAMKYYQSLSEFLWMDKTNISHETIMNRIKEGTLVLGLCKSDILPVLYDMKDNFDSTENNDSESDDENITDYRVAYVPSLTDELSSSCLSTTYGAFINPYGNNIPAADMFALYLSYEASGKQFAGNGKLPVRNLENDFDEMQKIIYAQYINSKSVPKVMLLGDYIQESGITYDAIWEGENVEEELDQLQNRMDKKMK